MNFSSVLTVVLPATVCPPQPNPAAGVSLRLDHSGINGIWSMSSIVCTLLEARPQPREDSQMVSGNGARSMHGLFTVGIEEEYFLVDAQTKLVTNDMPQAFFEAARAATGGRGVGEFL